MISRLQDNRGSNVRVMAGAVEASNPQNDKAERQAAQRRVTEYHQTQLRGLLDHVREGFARLDAGELDEFELDDLIHHYKRSAAKLWTFCSSRGAAQNLSYLQEQSRETDWWSAGASRRERSS